MLQKTGEKGTYITNSSYRDIKPSSGVLIYMWKEGILGVLQVKEKKTSNSMIKTPHL